jgi:hypothetical protein
MAGELSLDGEIIISTMSGTVLFGVDKEIANNN